MSKYSKDKFENNGEAILRNDDNQPDTLYDKVASDDDKTTPKIKTDTSVNDANEKARSGSFREASLYSTSTFTSAVSFGTISSPSNGLDEFTKLTTYKGNTTWTPSDGIPRKINPAAALGTGSNAIGAYPDIPTDSANLARGIDKNIISPAAKTYANLKSKIKTSISQKAASNNNTFTTDPNTVNRNNADFIYNSTVKTKFNRPNDLNIKSDTMALVFEPLDPFTGNILDTIKFLGYIASYNDSFSSTWNSTKYVGRAEKFYIFNEFKRNNTLGFQIPCYNKSELTKKHADLNKLSSILAGTYDGNGLLGGVISKITIGNYVYKQPSIIDTLSFSPIEGTSWDLDDKLAFYLKVDIGFTVIHNFLPQYGANFINV
jgi:hypothetical protein